MMVEYERLLYLRLVHRNLRWSRSRDAYCSSWKQVAKPHCMCKKPSNPDTVMYWCGHCELWEPKQCLVLAQKEARYLKSLSKLQGVEVSNRTLKEETVTQSHHDTITSIDLDEMKVVKSGILDGEIKCLICGQSLWYSLSMGTRLVGYIFFCVPLMFRVPFIWPSYLYGNLPRLSCFRISDGFSGHATASL